MVISWHKTFGWVLALLDVPDRKGILMHAANNAGKELKGCIGPVTQITGEGSGTKSKIALKKILNLLCEEEESENHFITIKSKNHESITTIKVSNA